MVGDIIQDPLGNLVGGAVAAGGWAIGSAINAYKQNYDFVTDYGRDFLNGKFTNDDLVDVPPPPAEDLGTVVPDASPGKGGASSSGSSGKTFEELATELVQNEAKYGIQSPIGPGGEGSVIAVPTQETNKDPQAPLKPGFTASPAPNPQQTLGSNKILDINWNYEAWPPSPDPRIQYYAKFRGQSGSPQGISTNGWRAFAIRGGNPDNPTWKVRVEAKNGQTTVARWTFDAGQRAPSPGELEYWEYNDYLFQSGFQGNFDMSAFHPNDGDSGGYYPLTQSALTPQPSAPLNSSFGQSNALPSWSLNNFSGTSWTDTALNNAEDSQLQFAPGLPSKAGDYLSTPVIPNTTVPFPTNNPAQTPVIGTNGFPVFNLPSNLATAADVHQIGDIAVNSGKIRATTASIAKEVGRIEQKSAAIAKDTGSLLDNLGDIADLVELINFIKELLEAPLDPKTFTLNPVCEEDKDPFTVTVPAGNYTDQMQGTLAAIPELLQAHLGFKTPICGNEKPETLGRWVTSRWLSDGDSPNGGRRLRKLFRYRTLSARTNEQLSEFWNGFTWQAGSTLVEHRKAWWGNPAVWAIDETEGKRIIRFAAGEAGLDPDLDGEWFVGSSRSPRIGMEGTMRLAALGRGNHVVSRDGSDGYPADS
jgi:hypothetical protein